MTALTDNTPAAIPEALIPYRGQPCIVFAAARSLNDVEARDLLAALNGFLSGWASHGSPVDGAGAVIENRFVVIAHRPHEIAGCSRDALLFFLKDVGTRFGLEWVGGSRVFYRDASGRVADVDRPGFRALAADAAITPDTVVFDTTVNQTDALLDGKFALAARDSWHARLMG